MTTGPNQILIKRSDTAGVEPSGLSFGEPAINTADGKLFFSKQTEGTASGDFWEFKGFTDDGFVTSVNGVTGDVTVTDLVGGATDIIGISNGVGFSGVTAVAFGSSNSGVTFSAAVSGQTASITLDLTALEESADANIGFSKYNYTVLSGSLLQASASSNGDFKYNPEFNGNDNLAIHKNSLNGTIKDNISEVVNSGIFTVEFIVGSADESNILYCQNPSFDGTQLKANVYDNFPASVTAGTGKEVNLKVIPDSQRVSARDHYRLPAGDTFGTVVSSFNGLTGDVTTNALVLHVAGISSDGGITFPDGTFQSSAASGSGGITELNGSTAAGITLAQGFRYKVSAVAASPSAPSSGEIAIKDLLGFGAVPSGFILHKNPLNSIIDLSYDTGGDESYFKRFADSGGIITITNEKTGKSAQFINSSSFTSSSNVLEYTGNANSHDATSAIASVGDFVIVQLDFNTDPGVKSIGGTAFQNKGDLLLGKGLTAENAGGGQGRLRLEQETFGFILDGNGSPLGTGDKLDALRQIPYGMAVDSTSAFVAAGVSGTDKTIAFAIKKTSALSGSISGTRLVLGNTASANQTGFTFDGIGGGIHFRELASASSVDGTTVNKNEWIFPEITGNSGDINKLQIFMKLKPQD